MKIVNKSVISNREKYLQLLDRLVELYKELDTDDIIRGYEWFESIDRYYIAFELAAGETLLSLGLLASSPPSFLPSLPPFSPPPISWPSYPSCLGQSILRPLLLAYPGQNKRLMPGGRGAWHTVESAG